MDKHNVQAFVLDESKLKHQLESINVKYEVQNLGHLIENFPATTLNIIQV